MKFFEKITLKFKCFVFISIVLFSSNIFTCDLSYQVESARIAGMGQAFTALSDDLSAIWVNPAGISRVRKNRSRKFVNWFSSPNIFMSANQNGQTFYNAFQKNRTKVKEGENLISKSLSELGEIDQERICFSIAANPVVYFDYPRGSPWAFGAFSSLRTELTASTGDTHSLIQSVSDTGIVLGKAWTGQNNRLTLGFQWRFFWRYDYYDSVDNALISSRQVMSKLIKDKGNKGVVTAIDIGGLWTVADYWFPTFAFSLRNLPLACQSNYLGTDSEERVKACGVSLRGTIKNEQSIYILDPMEIRYGFSLTPRLSRKFAFRIAIDMHKGYIKSGTTYYGVPLRNPAEQFHAGVEAFLENPLTRSPFAVRGGYNGVGLTGGFTLRASRAVIDFATYEQKVAGIRSSGTENSYLLGFSLEVK